MEPARPAVDAYLLDFLEERSFNASDFFETRKGVCRIMPPLSRELASTVVRWARTVAPVTEDVARLVVEAGKAGSRGILTRRRGTTKEGRDGGSKDGGGEVDDGDDGGGQQDKD